MTSAPSSVGIRARVASVLVGILVAALPAAPVAASPVSVAQAESATRHRPVPPHVVGDHTVPAYSYADAIRESVWVETRADSDGDGVRDRVAVDLVRPREAAAAGVRVPVIMDASPYYLCCGRGNESELKTYDAAGVIAKAPLFYDNYFVPRGYAFAAVDLAGTARSTGCEDVGGPAEVGSAKAVIDWLNGRARAFTADGRPVSAAWSTGRVGMIGKSWDGSVANGVAATGVPGLATIVPISAISSWYDYMRYQGVLRSTDYPGYLHSYVNGRGDEACADVLARLRADSAEETGDYNRFWAQRDYRPSADRVRASVFVAHGLNDLNVTTNQFAGWWQELADEGVPRKLWLYQAGHEDPFDVRRAEWVAALHRWFDYWLQGLRNGVMDEPRVDLETAPGTWTTQRDWPAPGTRDVRIALGDGDGVTGTLGGRGARPGQERAYVDESLTEAELVAEPSTATGGRLVFLSGALTTALRISGSPSVRLRIRVDRPTTELTARLVDYGTAERLRYGSSEGVRTLDTESCWGASTDVDDACYRDTEEITEVSDHAVLTRGWRDAAHHRSLRFSTPLLPDRWYSVTVPLNAYDAVLPAGHVLGLVLGQSDPEFTETDDQDATVRVDLGRSELILPVTGRAGLPAVDVAPPVVTAPADPSAARTARDIRPVP
ncbi:Xaa-Pro dipeptidyl-peptidase [Micromonospora parathelypteridis]|uniref:X-Pro dipeptidyl-peptidase n=1 Tax=Micromonospora parathelypteridis TaxID=1839617 RepID=A0A840VWW7_9ACTN|nr:Xaa-Pro dipeptidyl-peptidase [Micromonospora parathelypteridis]MBB5481107.1 X-Pro dipeptidyl-peptidase [Micromonospora parathelypteridis]GGO20050.1 X-Pro dipeptidyl-peptidase [Micromonospora parathelypteridis]